ncbi:hypothetical protein C8E03_106220 [Lachnotalea glycerini]|uniref:YwqI/YxiC family protein n=1 Tax=Lachnotalea glycerini TaxID=1763509 RepID=A0A255JHT0_9FIRM|nr:hypothetical protein [Lachnotalea glycerini]OYO51532.1 hypothetical protein CG709_19165 [Lachnotalea glycerini]PXV89568.1 hypothetical protein C8E03_106220 [Lachnotalea glycerini]RDY32256.1 hypothetical protein CG710_004535 [Lachnotalea glycerini]
MANIIQLNQSGFLLKVNAMEKAGQDITEKVNKPEITGNMPTLQKYLETYDKIQEALTAYKELIEEDTKRLKSAQVAMTLAESQIIKK